MTEAAGTLRKLGAIDDRRGHNTVRDRTLQKRLGCECYMVVRRETARRLPGRGADA